MKIKFKKLTKFFERQNNGKREKGHRQRCSTRWVAPSLPANNHQRVRLKPGDWNFIKFSLVGAQVLEPSSVAFLGTRGSQIGSGAAGTALLSITSVTNVGLNQRISVLVTTRKFQIVSIYAEKLLEYESKAYSHELKPINLKSILTLQDQILNETVTFVKTLVE